MLGEAGYFISGLVRLQEDEASRGQGCERARLRDSKAARGQGFERLAILSLVCPFLYPLTGLYPFKGLYPLTGLYPFTGLSSILP